jgi:hypothetical protein
MQMIIVNIGADGEVKVEAQGIVGAGCQQVTRAIEQALGSTVSDRKKPEYFQQEKANVRAAAGNNG